MGFQQDHLQIQATAEPYKVSEPHQQQWNTQPSPCFLGGGFLHIVFLLLSIFKCWGKLLCAMKKKCGNFEEELTRSKRFELCTQGSWY